MRMRSSSSARIIARQSHIKGYIGKFRHPAAMGRHHSGATREGGGLVAGLLVATSVLPCYLGNEMHCGLLLLLQVHAFGFG